MSTKKLIGCLALSLVAACANTGDSGESEQDLLRDGNSQPNNGGTITSESKKGGQWDPSCGCEHEEAGGAAGAGGSSAGGSAGSSAGGTAGSSAGGTAGSSAGGSDGCEAGGSAGSSAGGSAGSSAGGSAGSSAGGSAGSAGSEAGGAAGSGPVCTNGFSGNARAANVTLLGQDAVNIAETGDLTPDGTPIHAAVADLNIGNLLDLSLISADVSGSGDEVVAKAQAAFAFSGILGGAGGSAGSGGSDGGLLGGGELLGGGLLGGGGSSGLLGGGGSSGLLGGDDLLGGLIGDIGGLSADAVKVEAHAICDGGTAVVSGDTVIANLTFSGLPVTIPVGTNTGIDLGLVKLMVNEQVVTGSGASKQIHVTGLVVDIPGVIGFRIGEASAGITCNCAQLSDAAAAK